MAMERILGTDTGKAALEKTDRNVVALDTALGEHKADLVAHGGGVFKGVAVRKTTNQSVGADHTFLTWQEAIYDTNSFFNVANPTRLTIPAGITRVKVSTSTVFAFNSSGQRKVEIMKNNGFTIGRGQMQIDAVSATLFSDGSTICQVHSTVFDVVEGDYFEIRVAHNVATLNVNTASSCWFELEVVE